VEGEMRTGREKNRGRGEMRTGREKMRGVGS